MKRNSIHYRKILVAVFCLYGLSSVCCFGQDFSQRPEDRTRFNSAPAVFSSEYSLSVPSGNAVSNTGYSYDVPGTGNKPQASEVKTPIPGPQEKGQSPSSQNKSALRTFVSMVGSLLLVLGIFFGIVVCLKKILPKDKNSLPAELIGCIGQYALTSKHRLYLVAFGPRLLLLCSAPEGLSVLTEINSPKEAEYFVQCAPKAFSGSSSPVIREILDRIRKDQRERKEAAHVQ